MKNKHLIIGVIIGIILFFPTSEARAMDCTVANGCKYITYNRRKNGTPTSMRIEISFRFYELYNKKFHMIDEECYGDGCNKNTFFTVGEGYNGIAELYGHNPPVAICVYPGKYEKNYKGIYNSVDLDGNIKQNQSNYQKYMYYSHEEVDNAISKGYCSEDDIRYNTDSYPRDNYDGTGNSSGENNEQIGTGGNNNCLDAEGLRCYYKDMSDSKNIIQYGYTKNRNGDLTQFYLVEGKQILQYEGDDYVDTCTCPDYVYYDKKTKMYATMYEDGYQKNKSNKNYKFYKITDSSNVSEDEVDEDGVLAEIGEDKKYDGEIYCGIFGEGTFGFIKSMYTIVKILIPVLIIVLGIIDFLKVVFSGEEKDMKASGTRFLKRIIAGIIFILLPALIEFLMSIVGFSEDCLQQLIK